MKDYEKKYKEALERAKKYKLKEDLIITQDLFPELKESEENRIKSNIQFAVRCAYGDKSEQTNKILDWLESQGETSPVLSNSLNIGKVEHKPADKVEPKIIDWSKHIKYEPNSPSIIKENPAWSEEDLSMMGRIRSIIEKYAFSQSAVDVNGELCEKEFIDADNWLKSLKERVQPRPTQEWSEEDEEELKIALDTLEKAGQHSSATWLKNVCLVPQNTWKPSEGQLECLGYAIEKAEKDWSPLTNNRIYLTLKALKEQLLELRGSKV